MPWSAEFIEALSLPYLEPCYLLETIQLTESTSTDFAQHLPPMRLGSVALDADVIPCITREGSSVTYGELTPGTWRRSYGQLTVAVGTTDVRLLCARGQAVQLRVGFTGWTSAQFQVVWVGVIRNVTYRAGSWSIECTEVCGSIQNRFADEADEQSLFYDLGSTTLSADFTAGVDPTVSVVGSSSWEGVPGDKYGLRVTPSGGGQSFVLLCDSLAGTVFTLGLLAEDRLGTTAEDAATGDEVTEVAYSEAHPIRIAARVLSSSGVTGLNGDDDVFPAEWGYGIRPAYLDRVDMDFFVDATGGDSRSWQLAVEAKQVDGLQWLEEWLQPGGFFLTLHQGAITVRAVRDDNSSPSLIAVDDSDIVEIVEYHSWDDSSPIEYRKSRAVSASGNNDYSIGESNIATRPTKAVRRRDLLAVIDTTDVVFWVEEVATRLGVFDTRVPERVVVEVAGWRAAVVSLGELVVFSTAYLTRRVAANSAFNGEFGLLVGGGCDWFGSSCRLELLFAMPTSELE